MLLELQLLVFHRVLHHLLLLKVANRELNRLERPSLSQEMERTSPVLSLHPGIGDLNLRTCGMVLSSRRGKEGLISKRVLRMEVEVTLGLIFPGKSRHCLLRLESLRRIPETLSIPTVNAVIQPCLPSRIASSRTAWSTTVSTTLGRRKTETGATMAVKVNQGSSSLLKQSKNLQEQVRPNVDNPALRNPKARAKQWPLLETQKASTQTHPSFNLLQRHRSISLIPSPIWNQLLQYHRVELPSKRVLSLLIAPA